ncbi:MAG: hypothetical protein F2881_03170 [Actinobacteria bacterium]|uniref:Unannotated protein n=1 Tax=freshwater metagenome TaxID=449393 RepID=A0A6J7P8X1_9ZZZZ|nr:hypothetical protein [Actinomycetota bacterium]
MSREQMSSRARWVDRACAAPIAVAMLVGVTLMGARNLTLPDFWWDEAGQYWMSQGQNHGSAWGAARAPLETGISLGRNGSNLDPLGFTAVLRYWVAVFGSSAGALRALPFVFYVATALVSVAAARRLLALPWVLSLALPFLVLAGGQPMQYSTELRAYSLELLGVVTTGVLLLAYLLRRSRAWLGLLLVGFVIFSVCSRYSFAFAVLAATGVVVVSAALRRDSRSLRDAIVTVVVSAGVGVFLLWNVGLLGGGRQASPHYFDEFLLAGNWRPDFVAQELYRNFGSPLHVFTGAFLLSSAGWVVGQWIRGRRAGSPSWLIAPFRGVSDHPWLPIAGFVSAYEVLAVAASALGQSPWDSTARWSIGLYGIAVLSALGLASLGLEVVRDLAGARALRPRWRTVVVVGLAVVVVAGALGESARALKHLNDFRRYQILQLWGMVDLGNSRVQDLAVGGKWLVESGAWPTFRMLWETEIRDTVNGPAPEVAVRLPAFGGADVNMARSIPDAIECAGPADTFVLMADDATRLPLTLDRIRAVAPGCLVEVIPGVPRGTLVRVARR